MLKKYFWHNQSSCINLQGEFFSADADWSTPLLTPTKQSGVNAQWQKANDLTLSMQEGGKKLSNWIISMKRNRNTAGGKTVALVSQDNKDKEATDLVTDLVRMGYFFRRRRYCCNSRIWMAASRIGRLSTGIVHRLTVPYTAATELTGTKFGTRCGDIFLSTSLRDC